MRHRGCVFGRKPVAAFDPATLGLSGWWRASYSGSPWSGSASTGSSGSRSLSEATNPPATGSAVNGFTPPDYNGSSHLLGSSLDLNSAYITSSAFTIICLFWADTAPADAGAAAPYQNVQLFGSSGGSVVLPILTYSTAGVGLGWYDGSWTSVRTAAAAGAWHMVKARYNGTNSEIGLGSGSMSTLARGAPQGAGGTTLVGRADPGQAAKFFDGKILELMVAPTVLSDTTINTDIRGYLNTRYGLSIA